MDGIPLLLRSNTGDNGSSAGSVVPTLSLLYSRTVHRCRNRAEIGYDRVQDPTIVIS